MTIQLGDITLSGRVLLAPMSGVTDFAFRKAVAKASRVSVVSEMVASEELVKARADVVRRAEGFGLSPLFFNWRVAIHWMREGARLACAAGADVVDINMGCPSRQVTGGLSGSALMRDESLDSDYCGDGGRQQQTGHAENAFGWDADPKRSLSAERAEALGVHIYRMAARVANFIRARPIGILCATRSRQWIFRSLSMVTL